MIDLRDSLTAIIVVPSNGTEQMDNQDTSRRVPDLDEFKDMVEGGYQEATDGCIVEPDGHCEHGCQSWLIRVLGLI